MKNWKRLIVLGVVVIAAICWFASRNWLAPGVRTRAQPVKTARLPSDGSPETTVRLRGGESLESSGFRTVVVGFDSVRIANAPTISVSIDDKRGWIKLVEDTLVQRNGIQAGLRRQFEQSVVGLDRSYNGRVHLVATAIGELRDRKSLPILAPHLDFELDHSTIPIGQCFPSYFPVADAIINIGGLDAAEVMLELANNEMNGRQVFLAALVIRRSVSASGAIGYLQSSLARGKSALQVQQLQRVLDVCVSEDPGLEVQGLGGTQIDGIMQQIDLKDKR